MKVGGNVTKKFKMISLTLVISIILQIIMPVLLPLKSMATDNTNGILKTSLGNIIIRKAEQTEEQKSNGILPIEIYIEGTDIYAIDAYFDYNRNVFEELQRSDVRSIINGWKLIDINDDIEDYGEGVGYNISMQSTSKVDGYNNFTLCIIDLKLKQPLETNTDVMLNYVKLTNTHYQNTENDPGAEDGFYTTTNYTINLDMTAKTYAITYNDPSNSATNMPQAGTKTEGEPYTIASAPIRTGYNFTGWNTSADGTGSSYSAGTTYNIDADLTLYAQWEGIKSTLTVDPNGGIWENSSNPTQIMENSGTEKTISNPTKTQDGYIVQFNPNGGTLVGDFRVTQTTTFDKWELTSGGGTLAGNKYTFGENDGTITAKYRRDEIQLPTATINGATIEGWYTEQTGGQKVGNAGGTWMPNESTTLFAHWSYTDYQLTIDPNGGTYKGTTGVTTEPGVLRKRGNYFRPSSTRRIHSNIN